MTEERLRIIAAIVASHADLGDGHCTACGAYGLLSLYGALRMSDSIIAELLIEVGRLRGLATEAVGICDYCDGGYTEYQQSGADAFLPTGDPNIITAPCPYCGPALRALNKDFYAD